MLLLAVIRLVIKDSVGRIGAVVVVVVAIGVLFEQKLPVVLVAIVPVLVLVFVFVLVLVFVLGEAVANWAFKSTIVGGTLAFTIFLCV